MYFAFTRVIWHLAEVARILGLSHVREELPRHASGSLLLCFVLLLGGQVNLRQLDAGGSSSVTLLIASVEPVEDGGAAVLLNDLSCIEFALALATLND